LSGTSTFRYPSSGGLAIVPWYRNEMADDKDYDGLRDLDLNVLDEVVREGDAKLDAQLQVATAADQRALTLAGFQITAATGAVAGGVALMTSKEPDKVLALIAFLFALALLTLGGIALWTVVHRQFKTPGNLPLNWRKDRWRWQDKGFDIKAARVEQAACLEEQIATNRRQLDWSAALMRASFRGTIITAMISSVLLMIILF
jgi:hypothetical protein